MSLTRRNIVYFSTTLEPEPGDDSVGWAVAEPIRAFCRSRGATVGAVRRYWDGVQFSCRFGRPTFSMQLTPYFEATPLHWSVSVAPRSFWKYLRPFLSSDVENVCRTVDAFFASDERYTLLRWESLRED